MPQTYQVRQGDTLWGIAQRLLGDGNRWREIAAANGVNDPRRLQVGAQLQIPGGSERAPNAPQAQQARGSSTAVQPTGGTPSIPPMARPMPTQPMTPRTMSYTVQAGDNLSTIARRLGVDIGQITGYRSGDPSRIYPGEVLTIVGSRQAAGNATMPGPVTSGSLPPVWQDDAAMRWQAGQDALRQNLAANMALQRQQADTMAPAFAGVPGRAMPQMVQPPLRGPSAIGGSELAPAGRPPLPAFIGAPQATGPIAAAPMLSGAPRLPATTDDEIAAQDAMQGGIILPPDPMEAQPPPFAAPAQAPAPRPNPRDIPIEQMNIPQLQELFRLHADHLTGDQLQRILSRTEQLRQQEEIRQLTDPAVRTGIRMLGQ